MSGKWFRWQAAICGALLTGCSDWPGDPDDTDDPVDLPGGVNVFNCSSDTIGVFWISGTLDWDVAESFVLPMAHGPADPPSCGQSVYIPFNDYLDYWVRFRKDILNCSAQGSSEFEPSDCMGEDKHFVTDPEGSDSTWKVQ